MSLHKFGLYIHIPFCKRICPYCDFYKLPFRDNSELLKDYIDAISSELKFNKDIFQGYFLSSIFFGGGSPSLLNEAFLAEIFEKIFTTWKTEGQIEITLEANPEDISLEKALAWKNLGINRISLGIQSFDNKSLKLIGRTFERDKAIRSYLILREAGFRNINFDLIYARPEQSLDMWREELLTAFSLSPEHLSLYELTFEKGTAFYQMLNSGKLRKPPTNKSLAMYRMARTLASEFGFQWYEISNYAKNGKKARHNLNIWQGGNYLGLGPSAHSLISSPEFGMRKENVSDLRSYLSSPNSSKWSKRNRSEALKEFLLNGLRLREGISPNLFVSQYKDESIFIIKDYLTELTREGYFDNSLDNIWRLTPKGAEIIDSIAAFLFEIVDNIAD